MASQYAAAPAQARRRLTGRQLAISIAAVVALPILLVAGLALTPSKLERAGQAIDEACVAQEVGRHQLRFAADYGNTDCLLAVRAELEGLGFDRGALEDAAEGRVTAGRYSMTAGQVDDRGPLLVTISD